MRVLFFAQVRQAAGCPSVDLPLASASQDDLWQALIARFPDLAAHRASVRLARNGHFADPDVLFAIDDEVALIPPVSGG